MESRALQPLIRVGHGYDLHRLEPRPPHGSGRPLVLGGLRLEHARGPVSHSDGDAVYHALTDALLGAIGAPDIGQLFPDTDPRHESADSSVFVAAAAERVARAGYQVGNLDITIICEEPRIGPHKEAMVFNVARLLGCERSRVNVKGKTHEQVDAVGEGRAVEVHCVVALVRSE
jgi:2-C-methyl-D-erythritol 2,4-cyclodiphosphate synthase